ncbi:hypothetical protein ACP26L_19410 [Paenibacillus sp. S-38]|uniref:hypothetical protein n=1 Tax=Paenibacillus sp. S-38 TaxID=3416710 RepID=UPI003CF9E514
MLIRFASTHAPWLTGLGTLSAYGMLIIVASTDLRSSLPKKVWLWLHLLSYPVFVMAWIHGFFQGTDTQAPAVRWMYVLTAACVAALTAARIRSGTRLRAAVERARPHLSSRP